MSKFYCHYYRGIDPSSFESMTKKTQDKHRDSDERKENDEATNKI